MTLQPARTRAGPHQPASPITPFLWFEDQAMAAASFYTSVFKSSEILTVTRYSRAAGSAARKPAGSVMTVEFVLAGQRFIALNGGPCFKLNPAVSFVITCSNQREIDYFWRRLARGGRTSPCGWLTDKFGVSWQVVPAALPELLQSGGAARAERVMQALLRMTKLDLRGLQAAARRATVPVPSIRPASRRPTGSPPR